MLVPETSRAEVSGQETGCMKPSDEILGTHSSRFSWSDRALIVALAKLVPRECHKSLSPATGHPPLREIGCRIQNPRASIWAPLGFGLVPVRQGARCAGRIQLTFDALTARRGEAECVYLNRRYTDSPGLERAAN